MTARILTMAGISVAAIALSATTATAAAPASAPNVANTSQTLTLYQGGSVFNSDTIDFATTTWSLETFADTGTFKDVGSKLTMKTTSSVDKGCKYSGKYRASTGLYAGKVKCPHGGFKGTFTVTTTGDDAHPAAQTHSLSFIR